MRGYNSADVCPNGSQGKSGHRSGFQSFPRLLSFVVIANTSRTSIQIWLLPSSKHVKSERDRCVSIIQHLSIMDRVTTTSTPSTLSSIGLRKTHDTGTSARDWLPVGVPGVPDNGTARQLVKSGLPCDARARHRFLPRLSAQMRISERTRFGDLRHATVHQIASLSCDREIPRTFGCNRRKHSPPTRSWRPEHTLGVHSRRNSQLWLSH